MRILIVEDQPDVAKVIQATLMVGLMDVTLQFAFAVSLSDAMRLASDADLILLDLLLPDSGDPSETMQRFEMTMMHVPTIIITGLDEGATAVMAALKGAKGCVFKPKIGEQLVKVIKTVFKKGDKDAG